MHTARELDEVFEVGKDFWSLVFASLTRLLRELLDGSLLACGLGILLFDCRHSIYSFIAKVRDCARC